MERTRASAAQRGGGSLLFAMEESDLMCLGGVAWSEPGDDAALEVVLSMRDVQDERNIVHRVKAKGAA